MLYLAPQLLSFAPSTGGALAARRRLAPLAMYEQPAAVGELTSILEVQADDEAAAAAAALREILGEAEEPLFEEEEGETISAGGDPENLTIPQLKELLKAKGLRGRARMAECHTLFGGREVAADFVRGGRGHPQS